MAKKKPAAAAAPAAPQIKDRIKEFRRVPASELRPNPENWRTHPKSQADALRAVLGEIGVVDAVLAFPADGLGPEGDFSDLMLFDGHLRLETLPDQELPVLVTDLTRDEARKAMLTIDPLAVMAEADAVKLDALLKEVQTGSEALQQMLAELAQGAGLYDTNDEAPAAEQTPVISFNLVFDDEHQQQVWFAFLRRLKETAAPEQETHAARLTAFLESHATEGSV